MLNEDLDEGTKGDPPSPDLAPDEAAPDKAGPKTEPRSTVDESLIEELGAVIDDAKLYATAELAFQKTRAKLLGKNTAIAAGAIVLAIILLHISIIALAVGLVIALEPLVTIWGAIAVVVGVMLLGVGVLGYVALSKGRLIGEMFASDTSAAGSEDDAV